MCKFNDSWKHTYAWLSKSKNNECGAYCNLCKVPFLIGHGGENDVKKHMNSERHRTFIKTASSSRKIDNFFVKKGDSDVEKLLIAETTFVYHTVFHSHSYLSSDCAGKLFPQIFSDSTVACKFRCGRTKTSKISQNCLASASKLLIIQDLANNHKYSVATDASNKGNIKTFPLVLRYFDKGKGVQTRLLSFFNLDAEKSTDISNAILEQLNRYGLDIKNATAYSADNASVNFGKHQSVFTELKKNNENILPSGCVCHILHNCIKKATALLKFDIELIVIKSYNEFSSSTIKTTALKEFFEFCDLEWSELLRHVPTRWLTLIPAVERLLKNFEPVKSYFLSQNKTAPILIKFFEHDLAEAYLGFLCNIGNVFLKTIKTLESDDCLVLELYQIMENLNTFLLTTLNEKFYGFIAHQTLKKCDNTVDKDLFVKEATAFIEASISYINKWYNFTDNKFKLLAEMALSSDSVKFDNILEIVSQFNIQNINVDLLFEEFVSIKNYLSIATEEFKFLKADQKWVCIFKNLNNLPNFELLCQFIFSLPHSNANPERIFSLAFNHWRKERNRMSLKTVEAELLIKFNFNMSCSEFTKYLKTAEGKKLLQEVKSSNKYLES